MRRVVITGMGALTPIGNTVQEFSANLFAGVSGAAPITQFDASKFKTRFACEVKGFNAENFIERAALRRMDPVTHYAIAAADEAMKQAGFDMEQTDRTRFGVIWASGQGGFQTVEEQITDYVRGDGTPRFNPFFIPRTIVDITSGQLAIRYGLNGINFTTVSACASSNSALMDAFNYIRWGKADMFITGGSEAAICASGVGGFNAMKAMSTRNDEPTRASRPYDADRDGFVMGEGAAALVLEEYEHAIARGATILAEVIGAGMSADAYHLTSVHPEGLGPKLAMKAALDDAGIAPHEVDYINTHGTSTPNGDIIELKAIRDVFGDHAPTMNISSTKSMIGHLLGAAGAVEAVISVLALQHQTAPPTINLDTPDPDIPEGFNLTPHVKQEREINVVMSNTFGFGGHNAIAVFRRHAASS
ncbi:MAG: beta-ketoacyl-ACP synthase II [Bacteroidetes bacterium]|nr:beta-ketoacyl-ACP synthase II [Bacteroidota bacterium]